MARWAGGLLATHIPAICTVRGGRRAAWRVAQPFRNGLLLGMAAGRARRRGGARRGARGPGTRRRSSPRAAARELDPGERLGLALASVSALDGRLAWLRAGAVGCVLLRATGDIVLFPPPGGRRSSRSGGGPLRAATVDVRRDDVLVLAAAPLDAPALAELAAPAASAPGALPRC